MPKSVLQAIQHPDEKKGVAALLALGSIVVLLFIFRGQTLASAKLASLAAIGLAFVVDKTSRPLSRRLGVDIPISGYATVALTLFLTLVVQVFAEPAYADYAIRLNPFTFDRAVSIIPVLLATAPTIAIWLLKTRVVDGGKITLNAIGYATTVAALGALAIVAVIFVGDKLSETLVGLASG